MTGRSSSALQRSSLSPPSLGEVVNDFVYVVAERVAVKRVDVEFGGARVIHLGGVLLQFALDRPQHSEPIVTGKGRGGGMLPTSRAATSRQIGH